MSRANRGYASKMEAGHIHIGTSGWVYPHWRGPFYPPELPEREWLGYYAARFASVEVNNSFYRMPSVEAIDSWRDGVPAHFRLAIKASRYISHVKRLKDAAGPVAMLMERMAHLGHKLGPILFQLPPHWNVNPQRLADFLAVLPPRQRYAMEFRDPSWACPEVYELLAQHGVAWCVYEFDRRLSPPVITADFVYVRLHGPDGRYQGLYGAAGLERWAADCREWSAGGRDVFVYFDNDQAGYAPADAARLQNMIAAGGPRAAAGASVRPEA